MPRLSAKFQLCFEYLRKSEGDKYCSLLMHTRPRQTEPFVKLKWAPAFLTRTYPPEYLDGDAAGASPIAFAFRNGKLLYGSRGPWCIGTATWLVVEKGPVIVVGIDLDHAFQDTDARWEPFPVCTTTMSLVAKMMSLQGREPPDCGNRGRFQGYATTGTALWVPQGTAPALVGTAEGGISAVAFFPWLSSGLAAEHSNRNDICGKSIAQVAVHTLRSKKGEPVYRNALKAVPFFSSSE